LAKRYATAFFTLVIFGVTLLRAADVIDRSTLDRKVLIGYQGWFGCPGDGSPGNRWSHWSRGIPSAETLAIDLYPDLRELDADERCSLPGFTIQGKPAYLFSAWNRKTVLRHFQWMKQYGLDGVLVQRFITDIAQRRSTGDVVLKNVIAGAEATGRTFAIEYDVSGANPQNFAQILQDDWKYLIDNLKVTANPRYQFHNGKPLVSVWGMGLNEAGHPPEDAAAAKALIAWFHSGAPEKYRATYMGGTPSRWRSLTNDARQSAEWASTYQSMDIVQPWTVGRYRDQESADRWREQMLVPDLALAARNHQLYMPVIFPGFSWHNLKREAPPNQIPRNRGEFLWRQAYNAKIGGATMLKIAMFDEVNEGTAIFKAASHRSDAPDQGYWLTLDADGADLPSDWYLRLASEITRMFHGEIAPHAQMPLK
jgi:hypothetical protein